MKLHELKSFLREEPIETKTAEDLWSENGTDAVSYITTTVYYVKPVEGKKDQFEVTYDKNGQRVVYSTLNKADLDAAFTPVRPNQTPDAEGYTTYRSGDVYDAFKYGGDTVNVTLADKDPETVKLSKGDYLLRQDNGKEFTYSVEKSSYFSNAFTKQ